MKSIIAKSLCCFISLSSLSFSQPKIEKTENSFSIRVNFDEPYHTDKRNGILIVRDYPEYTDVSSPGKFKLPSKDFLIAIPPYSKPDIQLTDEQVETIKGVLPSLQPGVKRFNDSTLVNEEVKFSDAVIETKNRNALEIIGYGWYREYYYVQVKINTHSFDINTNKITRIKSVKLLINFGNNYPFVFNQNSQVDNETNIELKNLFLDAQIANQFVGSQPLILEDTTGNWINYGSEYLKIGTASDALFRITKSDLEAKGINTSTINPKTFRLFESGNEIPITVIGENDNILDDTDYIQFYGHLNYSKTSYRIINAPNEPYNEYLNRYTDTTFYFLTWGLQDGLRIYLQNSFISGLTDSLTYYTFLEHIESNKLFQNCYTDEVENQTPGWLRNKTWYFLQTEWLYSNTTRNYNFSVTDAVPNKIVEFYYKAVSFSSNIINDAHNLILKVNNVLIDSQSINRNEQVLLSGSLNTNQLTANPNVLSVKNYDNGSQYNTVTPDWYDIEYPRTLKLVNDFVLFNVSDDITSGLKVVKIGNAASATYEIYKVKPFFKKINNYQVNANQVLFTDTVSAGDQYIVVNPSKIGKPIFYYKKLFINLRSVSNQADYIAITHPKFLSSVNTYVDAIASMYGFTKDVISVEDIFNEFGYGYPTPESIRLFTEATYQNRQEPKPQYLTLIGDADYDYKLYRFKADGVIGGGNYVPSFGNPVSDNWLVIWDETGLPIPQMKVGRIPINTNEELAYYLSKVQNNFNENYDEWNKRYLFFSGGSASNPNEINQFKNVNNQVIDNLINPPPLAGSYTHFYKTINPLTDFGPYTPEEISNAIDEGGVFISYLGHSGTATWDNSINETIQLKNKFNKNPLITDFGCSTNKFAEPDIICFGERFLLNDDGQALGYIGNSSLGFTSTALTIPLYFYEGMISSDTKEVGEAHLAAKVKMFQEIGTSSVYKVFALTNTLIGDPAIKLKIPTKPNLKISASDVLLSNNFVNDLDDSTQIKIVINNFGIKDSTQFNYTIQHSANGNIIETFSGRRYLPGFKDTLTIWVKVKNLSGENMLTITLDTENEIPEIYEDDNYLTSNFYVYSTELRDLVKNRIENSSLDQIKILNPSLFSSNSFNIKLQLSESEDFLNYQEFNVAADSFFTNIHFSTLSQLKRYWLRYKLDNQSSEYSRIKSFYTQGDYNFYLIDSSSFHNQVLYDLNFNNFELSIIPKEEDISVTSAGYEAGATCVIAKNGINLLSNTFFAGMGIVVFDDVTFEVDTSAWFQLFNQPGNMAQLVALIDSIPQGKIVAMGVADDAANNITSDLKNAIKTLGSTKIDSLVFRGSWALIGKKGVSPGNVLEEVKGRYDGLIYLDSTFTIPGLNGELETVDIGPSTNWQAATIEQTVPAGASIINYIYGIRPDGNVDSLGVLNFVDNNADLSFVNFQIYPKIKIKSEFNASTEGISPTLSTFGINYIGVPELGTNYQVVSTTADTVLMGDDVGLRFYVYNVGEVTADSFKVKVDVVNEDNSHNTIFESVVDSLQSDSRDFFNVSYNTLSGSGAKSFLIIIDSDNHVGELYEDNNFYSMPFYIKPDTSRPSLKITFDGNEIIDGDYISRIPEIKIELSDESLLPITDTSAVTIFLNNEPVYYVNNQSVLSINFSQDNPKAVATYKPELNDGEYYLKVFGKNSLGTIADSSGLEKHFLVSSETQLLYVYNYPNPSNGETYFTFKLTQIPDEIKIKIYTIAGRLIKEIRTPRANLNYDFNKIYWNGRDEDGDEIANGVYLYKVILTAGDKTQNVIQKLAIVK